jgi:hypothetical protein
MIIKMINDIVDGMSLPLKYNYPIIVGEMYLPLKDSLAIKVQLPKDS